MSVFQPPPTWALPIITDERTGRSTFNPIWLNWFLTLAALVDTTGGSSVEHNLTSGLQGGSTSERYHLRGTQHTELTIGFTGSGKLARETNPTLIAPNIGAATATSVAASTFLATGGYTVTMLPAGTIGQRVYVTDATGPTFGAAVAGGGSIVTPVFYNGTAWIVG